MSRICKAVVKNKGGHVDEAKLRISFLKKVSFIPKYFSYFNRVLVKVHYDQNSINMPMDEVTTHGHIHIILRYISVLKVLN